MMGELVVFALVVLIGQFSPGPDMFLLTRTALAEGARAGWWMVLGISSGLALHGVLAIGGVAVVLAQGDVVSRLFSWCAAFYLFWLAWALVRKEGGEQEGEEFIRGPYLRGLFCNLLNPKVFVFFASVVAPFLGGGRPLWWPFTLWVIIVAQGLFFWGLWVRFLQSPRVRALYLRGERGLDFLFAAVLVMLAFRLLC